MGTPNVGPTNQKGEMADSSKACDSRAREYHTGHATATKTNDGTIASASVGQRRGCGQAWTTTHRQVCSAMGKKCNRCDLLNHFAKVCGKKLNNSQNSRQINRINNVETAETTDQNTSQENQNVNYISYYEQFICDYDSLDENYVATVENVRSPPIALQNMTITIGNTDCHLLLDFGSGCTIINMSPRELTN